MAAVDTPVDTAVLKAARDKCHKARDEFYACVEATGAGFALDTPVPSHCQPARAAYEASCKASWVRHFDRLEDKKSRYLQTLRTNIAKQTQTGTGSLAGKA